MAAVVAVGNRLLGNYGSLAACAVAAAAGIIAAGVTYTAGVVRIIRAAGVIVGSGFGTVDHDLVDRLFCHSLLDLLAAVLFAVDVFDLYTDKSKYDSVKSRTN